MPATPDTYRPPKQVAAQVRALLGPAEETPGNRARRVDHHRRLHKRSLQTARYWHGDGDHAEAAWALSEAARQRHLISQYKRIGGAST